MFILGNASRHLHNWLTNAINAFSERLVKAFESDTSVLGDEFEQVAESNRLIEPFIGLL